MGRFTSTILVAALCFGLSFAEYPNFDVTKGANGYHISGPIVNTKTGLQFPLSFNDKGSQGLDHFGKTIKDLKVTVDYETEDCLRVLITDKADKQFLVPDSYLGLERPSIKKLKKPTMNLNTLAILSVSKLFVNQTAKFFLIQLNNPWFLKSIFRIDF
ncbi:unnamed protein product [Cunninghamella echinulata]